MIRKNIVTLIAVLSLVGVTAFGAHAYAREATEVETPETTTEQKHRSDDQNRLIEEHKTALKDRFEEAKETRMNKLEDKRLEMCQKRQDKINSIISKGTEQSRKQLAVFQKIEQKVKQFYTDKKLSATGYDAAVANADAKEAAAIAAIEASAETTFDCNAVDGAKPGDAMRELMKARHQALKDYRTAVKDLILVVKKASSAQQSDDKPTESTEGQ